MCSEIKGFREEKGLLGESVNTNDLRTAALQRRLAARGLLQWGFVLWRQEREEIKGLEHEGCSPFLFPQQWLVWDRQTQRLKHLACPTDSVVQYPHNKSPSCPLPCATSEQKADKLFFSFFPSLNYRPHRLIQIFGIAAVNPKKPSS